MGYGQYGEDEVLRNYFAGKQGGFVVDVGAADGVVNSNSRMLIHEFGWSGILIEPEVEAFAQLAWTYKDSPNVKCINCGVAAKEGLYDFHVSGQVSTFSEAFKRGCILKHKLMYPPPVKVLCRPLQDILLEQSCPAQIDLMSIDCEGWDEQVVQSMDWKKHQVDLLLLEGVTPACVETLQAVGIVRIGQTRGNRIFRRVVQ